jgi:hypothetical protein
MKRSEAIQLLEQLAYDHQHFDGIDGSAVLEGLTKAGMRPPSYVNPKAKKEYAELIEKEGITWAHLKYIDDYMRAWEKPYEFYLQGWEAEDET